MMIGFKDILPVSSAIVAILRHEVIIDLPEDMECNAAIWCYYITIGFLKHSFKVCEVDVFAKEFVCQLVDFQQHFKFLRKKRVQSNSERSGVQSKETLSNDKCNCHV